MALTEADVEAFVAKIKDAAVDTKVNLVQLWGIKLETTPSLPPTTLDALTLTVAPFLRSSSQLLVTSTLSNFLPSYLPHLPADPPAHVRLALASFLPALVERLGGTDRKTPAAAGECVLLLGKKAHEADGAAGLLGARGREKESAVAAWESGVLDALRAKVARQKLEAIKVVVALKGEEKRMRLASWLSPLVALLEDGDGSVRDQARESLVALLSPESTPPAARSQLKKLMQDFNVRKSIQDPIISRVFAGPSGLSGSGLLSTTASGAPSGASTPLAEGAPDEVFGGGLVGSAVGGRGPERSAAATPVSDDIAIVHVASAKDLESEFATMARHFEGKETELNWAPREKALIRIRGMLRGQAFVQFSEDFMPAFRVKLLEGLAKTLLSLRTTVAQQACALTQELPEYTGSAFDPCVETLFAVLGKMAGFTKRIIADKSQKAVTSIITCATAAPRIYIAHIVPAAAEKNVQTRTYAMTHLKTFFEVQGRRAKTAIDGTPGAIEQLEEVLRKGLADMNPHVRDLARAAFWAYDGVWTTRAQALLDSLDGMAKTQLEKANPKQTGNAAGGPAKPPVKARQTSASSAIAELKRRKAAELAAQRAEAARAISPVPGSPAIVQAVQPSLQVKSGTPSRPATARPASRTSPSPSATRPSPTARSISSPNTSPSIGRPASRNIPATQSLAQPGHGSPLAARSRASSLARTLSHSPPTSSAASQISTRLSPLRHTSAMPTVQPPTQSTASSTTSGPTQTIRTPVQLQHTPGRPTVSAHATPTLGGAGSPRLRRAPFSPEPTGIDIASWSQAVTPHRPAHADARDAADEAARAQAAQALSAAHQMSELSLGTDVSTSGVGRAVPATPARPARGLPGTPGSVLRTPGRTWLPYMDSPRRARGLSPQIIERFQKRPYDKSFFNARKQLLAQTYATPQKPNALSPAGIEADVAVLAAGAPRKENFQRLTFFSKNRKIDYRAADNEDVLEGQRRIWETNDMFERIFHPLIRFLTADKPIGLLEDALTLLWELVENQWVMVEGHEEAIVDALFALRGCDNNIILEGTNSVVALLAETVDPVMLLSILRVSLTKLVESLPPDAATPPNPSAHASSVFASPRPADNDRDTIALAGTGLTRRLAYNFGLSAMAMCILDIPEDLVESEARLCEPAVMSALALPYHTGLIARQAAHRLILAVQYVLGDDARTLSLFPDLDAHSRSIVTYLMAQEAAAAPDTVVHANGNGNGSDAGGLGISGVAGVHGGAREGGEANGAPGEAHDEREKAVRTVLDTMRAGLASRHDADGTGDERADGAPA
ncbi:suppressor of tub2 mutation [Cryptotrichosporon argae]